MDGASKPKERPIPPIDAKRALILDNETELEPTVPTSGMAWEAIKRLELRQWISEAQFEAKRQFGQYIEVQLADGVMTTDLFETAEAIKRVVLGFSDLATKKGAKVEERIAAGQAAASGARSYRELMDTIARNSKEARERRLGFGKGKGARRGGPRLKGDIVNVAATASQPAKPANTGAENK